jgi:VWFA-related protein
MDSRVLLATLGLFLPAFAQQPPAQPAAEAPDVRIRTQVNVVVAPTTVTTKSGRFVSDLKPHEFRLYDRGRSQSIRVDQAFQPLSIVVLIQANDTAEPVLPKIRRVSSLLSEILMGQNGEIAIMAFDHRLQLLQDFTSESAKIDQALAKLRPGSTSSRMIDAITEATRMLRRRGADHRRIILLISETKDKGSEMRTREALLEIQFQNVLLYSVNINRLVTTVLARTPVPRPDSVPPSARHMPGGGSYTPEEVRQNQPQGNTIPLFVEVFNQAKAIFVSNPQEVLTRYTGGREFAFVKQEALEQAITSISEEVHSQYLISFNPSNKEEGGYHEIQVEVMRPDLEVRTRPGYWMAAVPE